MSDIIIPTTILSDYSMFKLLDPFIIDIIPNTFPLSIKNEVPEKGNDFKYLKLSLNKKYIIWRREMIEY
jgi:hypothetical protein